MMSDLGVDSVWEVDEHFDFWTDFDEYIYYQFFYKEATHSKN